MKKILDTPGEAVGDFIECLVSHSDGLAKVRGWNVVARADSGTTNSGQVAVLSGGGSGHEPAHAGYVGPGMLNAAVLGPVFTSPSVDDVLAGIRATAGAAGALLVVKNYTGDTLNFGLAAEMAKAEGIPVETVIVQDDVAIEAASRVGSRGIAGTVLVHKVAGAAAARGLPLEEVASIARGFAAKVASMGVATAPCVLPGASAPNFELEDDEVEWGLGIHGEAGRERGTMVPARELASVLVRAITARAELGAGARTAVLVNGLGTTTPMELEITAGRVLSALRSEGVEVERLWVGTFLSALDMAGCSVSIVDVTDQELELLDAPTDAAAWPRATGRVPDAERSELPVPENGGATRSTGSRAGADMSRLLDAVGAAARAVLEAEDRLTELDRNVGDGDMGTNLARGARVLLEQADTLAKESTEKALLLRVSEVLRKEVGGTSGPLYSLLVLGASDRLSSDKPDAATWAEAFAAGVAAVQRIGGARVGDRTMIDALRPAADALAREVAAGTDPAAALRHAVDAADQGARHTAEVQASLGRSSYLGERAVGHPDPGAVAVGIWLRALSDQVSG
ncbi:dihydroxyacetone kinase subunit L [Spiractinospora alimapuensis]|uniref:dihydroxyacetone kinase subunit DhaL n=1 Tax=Spiractinospora alimapuensis TaxID=2820884 RepID=UPI001F392261|nr:dihydroxyacetone kinase subunit DhaL [Spiractinospora alimapuensis]QVQ49998.1 dihydroxyacetone kinase subunit L [Spiractinospora alimapuensis]